MTATPAQDPPPLKLVEIVNITIDSMCQEYALQHQRQEPEPVKPRIIGITPMFDFALCPQWIALELFSSNRNKAALPWISRKFIEQANGGLYALMACSEAWIKSLPDGERDPTKAAGDYPDAGDCMLVTVYTLEHQWIWSQAMKDGMRDGAPSMLCMANASGNLVRKPEEL